MTEKINIAEILKECPKGMELDCSMWNNVVFDHIDTTSNYPIYIKKMGGELEYLTEDGHFNFDCDAKCVIFPKGKTTWEGFVPPCEFKDGDIVVTKTSNNFIFYSIYKGVENREVLTYVDYYLDGNRLIFNVNLCSLCLVDEIVEQKLATEEEKAKLFKAIKNNGYNWNTETKTLEKLSKFKVGDKIVKKDNPFKCWYVQGVDTERNSDYFYHIVTTGKIANLHFRDQDDWELYKDDINPKFKVGDKIKHKDSGIYCTLGEYSEGISAYRTDIGGLSITYKDMEQWELAPNKFDATTLVPFESRVLMRSSNAMKWTAAFYSHKEGEYFAGCGLYCKQCVPYEGNEHLLNTTNDCDEFYKNW